jgi:CHAD domain-containing protein
MGTPRDLPQTPQAALAPFAARLLAELRRARKDPSKVEAIHDARVAARRLAAAAELWLEAGASRDRLRVRLEKCVRRLGRVRNADVALEFLEKGPEGEAPARRALSKKVRRELKAQRRRLGRWLTGDRVKRIKGAMSRALSEAGEGGPPGPAALGRRFRAILRLPGTTAPMADPKQAHELRRQIRQLRYQHESIAAAYPELDRATLLDVFIRLQDAAGGWHDRFQVDCLAASLERKAKLKASAASLRSRLRAEMKEHAARFAEAFADLVRLKPVLLGKPGRPS